MHRLLQPSDYVRMPWKNGGGVTAEIALHPPGSSWETFDWRVSTAAIAGDAPFSSFPGVDRTLVLLGGAGIRLGGDGHAIELRTPFEPYAFSGDDRIGCTLLDGPVRDFNLMTRRGRTEGRVVVVRDAGMRVPPSRFVVCFAAAGSIECLLPAHAPLTLAADHALVVEEEKSAASAPLAVNPLSGDAVALVALIAYVR
jgi:environmental stress-induced protein Ves